MLGLKTVLTRMVTIVYVQNVRPLFWNGNALRENTMPMVGEVCMILIIRGSEYYTKTGVSALTMSPNMIL